MNRLKVTGKVRVGEEFELVATVEGEGQAVSTVARIIYLAIAVTFVLGAIFLVRQHWDALL